MDVVKKIIKDIDKYTSRDTASLDLFEMALETEWAARLALAKEIYSKEEIFQGKEIQAELDLLQQVHDHYLGLEEYERCARVLSLQKTLSTEEGRDTFLQTYDRQNDGPLF